MKLPHRLCFLATVLSGGEALANDIFVTTPVDKVSSTDGCSLKEAIWAANLDASQAFDSPTSPPIDTECNPGHGADVIILPESALFVISFPAPDSFNGEGATATPMVSTDITIVGNGSEVRLGAGAPPMRAFAVGGFPDSGNLALHDLYVTNFVVQAGSGTGGGGGGLGAGGAIYVNLGNLTVDNCTFQNNGALGGNGSTISSGAGGGGGGFGGDGGAPGDGSFSGGGGGGGARGDGGDGSDGGGGGGGTIGNGADADDHHRAPGGFRFGGYGGFDESLVFEGDDGGTGDSGGGGGGGETRAHALPGITGAGDGGTGGYGGGGGGGGYDGGDGGHGGFGGGGGGGGAIGGGGNGGFGGGGGGGPGGVVFGGPGDGGSFAGDGTPTSGGGGAGLGGAIFNHAGTIVLRNSTFEGNFVSRGLGAGDADDGKHAGGAIFSVDGTLQVVHCTISGNFSGSLDNGEGAGIVVYGSGEGASLELRNTIIANSIPLVRECFYKGNVSAVGSGNLVMENFGCPGMVSQANPLLGTLGDNGGFTPTMAIPIESPAVDKADPAFGQPTDQRGVGRPLGAGFDIGAFEAPEPEADVRVTKERSPAMALPGDTVTFTLGVSNLGPQDATNVVVVDDLPSSLTFDACSTASTTPCGGSGNHVTVTYATLANGASDTITITAKVPYDVADQTVAANSASIAADAPHDPHPENNTASASVTINNRSDLLVTQSVTKPPTKLLVYTVKVKNLGPYEARQIVLNDPIPTGTRFVSVSPGPWTCEPLPVGSVGTLSCTLSSLAANATATLTFTVRPVSPGSKSVVNTATATPRTFDPNPANNISILTTKVGSGK